MILVDVPDSKDGPLSWGEPALTPGRSTAVPGDEDDLASLVCRWLAETPAADGFDDISACAQAYLQALFMHCDTRTLAERDLLTVKLPTTASQTQRAQALFFLADHLQHKSHRLNRLLLLRTAFTIMDSAGLHDLLIGPATAMSRHCEEALDAGIAPNAVKRLIRQHRLVPLAPHVPNWPWLVRIYTLGRFSVLCGDQQLAFNGKSPRKALELLQALIAHGGRDVHISLLMQSLWPEESSSNLQNLFDNTLHRLRRILGPIDVLHVRNGKLTLDPALCWVDAWSFYRLTLACVAGQPSNRAVPETWSDQDARSAWRLYTGHFLQTEAESAWALPYRERLRNRFHRLVCAFGERLEQTQRWDDAIDVYERGVEVDNLAEMLYQRLMFCYQQLGEHAEALRVYRRCRELLSIVLNVAPSARTEQLRQISAIPPR